jgi:hypothetical protein
MTRRIAGMLYLTVAVAGKLWPGRLSPRKPREDI